MWLFELSFCIASLIFLFGFFIFKFSSVVLCTCLILGFFSPSIVVLGRLYDKVTLNKEYVNK
jgi:hypothetical protein